MPLAPLVKTATPVRIVNIVSTVPKMVGLVVFVSDTIWSLGYATTVINCNGRQKTKLITKQKTIVKNQILIELDNIHSKINKDTTLFFDMDGTLMDTDFANFLSYKQAIQSVIHTNKDISFNPNKRLNRTSLRKIIPNLAEDQYIEIIHQKEEYFKEHLPQTTLNNPLVDILTQYSKTNKTVLVSNCREDRVAMTLCYHNLTDKFSFILSRQFSNNINRINKYKNAMTSLRLSPQTILVFENEKLEIEDALTAGISINNILNFNL